MPTPTKSDPISAGIETATEKVAALGEKAVENGKKASSVLLDSSVADAQADFAREAAKSYTSAARTLVD